MPEIEEAINGDGFGARTAATVGSELSGLVGQGMVLAEEAGQGS